jgi:hypothetical protein
MTFGEFSCEWNGTRANSLTLANMQTFIAFWNSVGLWGRFTLPSDFWPAECPPLRRDLYKALSPSGVWKFKDKPKWDDFGGNVMTNPTLKIVLMGVIN